MVNIAAASGVSSCAEDGGSFVATAGGGVEDEVWSIAAVCSETCAAAAALTQRHSLMMVSLHATFEFTEVSVGLSSALTASLFELLPVWTACSSSASGGAGQGAWKTQLGLWQQYLSRWLARHTPLQIWWQLMQCIASVSQRLMMVVIGCLACGKECLWAEILMFRAAVLGAQLR